MSEKKIFEEYRVDCNDCSHYWNDTCDGVPQDLERTCTAYIATKRVNVLKRLGKLEEKVFMMSCILSAVVLSLIVALMLRLWW